MTVLNPYRMRYSDLEYFPPEVKILAEIYKNAGCNAAHIAKTLGIDKSYLSRILKNQEKEGCLYRKISEKDTRAYELYLTEMGKSKAEDFMQKSDQHIVELIQQLSKRDCELLREAFDTIILILNKCQK
uniref:MarR family winged helix-turn-helix transcriptional regulator n=1 Tax=Enterocloster clostridioformis TaxID=1531 RepID=UPI0025A58408|nr:MarR family winged helix-turn-helix transcriptional regulator [Enterocloster clostridioformis]